MAEIFVHFCNLLQRNANAIVVYFGVLSKKKCANFQHDHLTDTFTQWQKHHPSRNGTEGVLVLLLSNARLQSVHCLGQLLCSSNQLTEK